MVKTMLRYAGASDPGRVRRNNEDAWYVDADRGIFLVVDGIGGQAAGEKAAEIAVERIRARLERKTGTTEQRIREAIAVANNEILRAAGSNPEWQGMACVLTLAVVENGSAVIGHVGDSRLYCVRGGEIRKITHDHSPVGEREDSRELSESEAMRHPRRNEVYRDVGSEEHAPEDPDFIEIQRIPFEPDTALLLCSDGLSDLVPSREIQTALERNAGNPEAAARALIDAANNAGGKDNVTVVVVEGEQFRPLIETAPVPKAGAGIFSSRFAIFLYGVILAGGGVWAARHILQPPPVAVQPRVLVAGRNAAFPTIAAALTEAKAGDTVEVQGGEYREAVTLKDGVSVVSRPPLEAVLRPGSGPAVMADGVKGARLSGFVIQPDPQAPASAGIVLNNSEVEIDDTHVTGAAVGIEIRGTGSPVLRGNAIRDSGAEGVIVDGPATPWLSHNSFQRNKGAAVAARNGAHPVLIGNLFEKNGVAVPPEMNTDTVKEHNFFLDSAPPRATPRPGRKQ